MSNLSKIILKADRLASQVVKERDKWICQKCGKKLNKDNAQCSHVISRKNKALRHDLNNLKTLCKDCHDNWWHKRPKESALWFALKFPERFKYLEIEKHKIKRYRKADYENIINTFIKIMKEYNE